MPFNFSLLSALWNARAIEKIILEYERALPPRRVAQLGAGQS
jgi:alpha-glucosidase